MADIQKKDPVPLTNPDPYDFDVEKFARVRLDLLKECYEMCGIDLGKTSNRIEYKNYLINNPPIKSNPPDMGMGDGSYTDPSGNIVVPMAAKDKLARALRVAQILVAKGGFTKVQAAAIVGVFIDENGCNPHSCMKAEKEGKGVKGTGGFGYGAGIGSWTGESYKNKLLSLIGRPPFTPIESLSLEEQANIVIQDTLNGPTASKYRGLKTCTTIEDASATCVCITGGFRWRNPHPIPQDAKEVSDIYGRSNDKNFGPSPYHWNLDKRRLGYAKQVLAKL